MSIQNIPPLSDEQISNLWFIANGQHYKFARLIEKALKVQCPPCNDNCNQGRNCPNASIQSNNL